MEMSSPSERKGSPEEFNPGLYQGAIDPRERSGSDAGRNMEQHEIAPPNDHGAGYRQSEVPSADSGERPAGSMSPRDLARSLSGAYEVVNGQVRSVRIGNLLDRSQGVWQELLTGEFEQDGSGYVTFGVEDWTSGYDNGDSNHVDALNVYYSTNQGAQTPLGRVARLTAYPGKGTTWVVDQHGERMPLLPDDPRWNAVVGATERAIDTHIRRQQAEGQGEGRASLLWTPSGEMLDVVDTAGNPLGVQVDKADIHRLGLWHRDVRVWVTDGRNVLEQLRNADKVIMPGEWDVSVGGHVGAGETYTEAAMREAHEELGLQFNPEQLTRAGTLALEVPMQDGTWVHRCVGDNFVVVRPGLRLDDLQLQSSEVAGARLYPIDRLERDLQHPDTAKQHAPQPMPLWRLGIDAMRAAIAKEQER